MFEHAPQTQQRAHLKCANGALTLVHAEGDLFVVQTFEKLHHNDLLLIWRELAKGARQQVGVERTRQLDRRSGAGQLDRTLVIVEGGGWLLATNMVDMRVVCQAIQPGQERSTLPSIPTDSLP